MKRTSFTDERIIGILAEHEAGAKCADLCRKHGMSENTFYNWKAKFGGMTVPEAKRLKALEDENVSLKKLLVEQMLDLAAMKKLVSKSGNACREARGGRASEGPSRAIGTAGVPGRRGGSQDDPLPSASRAPDTVLRGRLRELANKRRRFGYRRLFVLLRREGEPSGINRIYRLYREDGGGSGNGPVDRFPDDTNGAQAKGPAQGGRDTSSDPGRGESNARWSLDFVHDQFANGQRFWVLNVVDDVTRECLAAIPDTSISGRRVARELTALIERRGKPGMIVSDNGTELNSNAILTFTATHRIEWHYIAPGKPMRDTASWRASTGRCGTSGP